MLKYAIIFCIIFFCNLTQGDSVQAGSYKQLVLVQTFPITTFFYKEVHYPYVRKNPTGIANYLLEHRPVFDAKDWVIDQILIFDGVKRITYCEDTNAHEKRLNRDLFNDDLTKKLRAKWPLLNIHDNEVEHWTAQFHDYGSCITGHPLEFFKESLDLLNKFDVGNILSCDSINPGEEYMFDRFLNRISSVVGKKVYIDCVESEDLSKQYISHVRICLNKDRDPVDCIHRGPADVRHRCNTEELVYYPIEPLAEK